MTIEFIRNITVEFIKCKQITPNRSEFTTGKVTYGKSSHLPHVGIIPILLIKNHLSKLPRAFPWYRYKVSGLGRLGASVA